MARWLNRTGPRCAELHEATPTRKPMTFHDLRASGLTWLAIRGDEALRIPQLRGE